MELAKNIKQTKLLKYIFLALIGTIILAISSKIKIPFSGVPAKTGSPIKPSNKYNIIVTKPSFQPNMTPTDNTTKVCIVIGTG